MNPERFVAPFLQKEEIEARIQEIGRDHPSTRKIPVDVLGFAEFDLRLQFDFAPIHQLGQDAFLRPDLTGIWFDPVVYREHSFLNRLRFSTAHELAHLFLHRDIYGALQFSTVKQWIRFIEEIPVLQYYRIEWQADEFAGRFLIPTGNLSVALEEAVGDANREGILALGKEGVLDFCSRALHSDFGVSTQAMQTRIRKSEFWPHPSVAHLPD